MIILGIETSCDDTGIALIKCSSRQGCEILSNLVSSQVKIHASYGGVVPNLAARAHLKNIEPCLKEALKQAKQPKIDLIAVTSGPGLIPSLLVGVNFAKALAYNWQKPILGINHLEGHIYANFIREKKSQILRAYLSTPSSNEGGESQGTPSNSSQGQPLALPTLCLVVSGGHTQLILMKGHGKYKLLGQTRDDAAGEAFDKVAKLLNLGYPGGPIISQKAQQGNPQSFNLPRPMINSKDFDFSFSGLKTAVLYLVKEQNQGSKSFKGVPFDHGLVKQDRGLSRHALARAALVPNMAASFQQAVIDVLIAKTIKAAKEYQAKTISVSGGVAANQELRTQMSQVIKKQLPNSKLQIPDLKFCTDNAAMVATAAFYRAQAGQKQSWAQIQAQANLKLVA